MCGSLIDSNTVFWLVFIHFVELERELKRLTHMRFRSAKLDISSGLRPMDCNMRAAVMLDFDGFLTAAISKPLPMMRTMEKEAK